MAGEVLAGSEDVIAECARIASAGDRILCLENALRRLTGESQAAVPAESVEIATQATKPVEIISDVVDTADPDVVKTPSRTVIETNAVDERPDTKVAVSATVSPPVEIPSEKSIESNTADPDSRDMGIEKFGAVEKKVIDDEPDSIDVHVVKVSKDPYGKLVFTTAGGQIWYQTDKRSTRFREIPFDAIIRTAAAGSFMLRPQSGGVSIRVKRRK